MRIVLMGTPNFAVPSLEALIQGGYEVVGVFTQPDRPSGRGNRIQMSPVKEAALKHGLPVFQPVKIRRDGVEDLRNLNPDLCVTAAFGQILSQEILDIPKLGTINVHASLLPRHRGSAPINWAIMNGDAEIGVTTMMTSAGIDDGDMLLRRAMPRDPGTTCGEYTDILSVEGAQLLMETIRQLEDGSLVRSPQNEAEMTYDPMLKKEMGVLDLSKAGEDVANRIMGLNPWPCASIAWKGEPLKLLRARAAEGQGQPGEVLKASHRDGLLIACGQGAVEILELQSPGKRAMTAADWLAGHRIEVGEVLA